MSYTSNILEPLQISGWRLRGPLAAVALAGGGLVVWGAVLPWLTLFAGLHAYPGTVGLNGRLMLAGGLLSMAGGILHAIKPSPLMFRLLAGLGAMLVCFAAWLGYGLLTLHREMLSNPMLVPRLGPGLAVVAAGAIVILAGSLAAWVWSDRESEEPKGATRRKRNTLLKEKLKMQQRIIGKTAGFALATLVSLTAACDEDVVGSEDEVQVYQATLQPLNGDVAGAVTGTVTFTVEDGQFVASVEATGMDAVIHPQHIHATAQCPTTSADANQDGYVDVIEGVPAYGPILVPLDGDLSAQAAGSPEGFPTGVTFDYQQTVTFSTMVQERRATDPNPEDAVIKLAEDEELNLEGRHVVVHGVTDDLPSTVQSLGGFPSELTLPIACGRIVRVS